MLECKGGLTDKPFRCKSPQDLVLTLICKSGEVEQAEMQSIRLLKFRSLKKTSETPCSPVRRNPRLNDALY